MSYRNNRFNQSMRSLGDQHDLSDRGLGIERMLDEIEPPLDDSIDPNQALAGAFLRLIVEEKEYLVETLLLIYKYRNNREEILKHMPKSSYFWRRDSLLEFFIGL